jgi:hypothetical protein
MKHVALVLMFFPLAAFCFAGVIEVRSKRTATEKLRSLVPIVLGIIAFGLLFGPGWFIPVTPDTSVTLSRVMTMVSAVIASSGAFVTYSRRSVGVSIACGGLLLTLVWMFNRTLA